MSKGEYADDVVLVASSRTAAEATGRAYVDVTRAFGLTVSLPKTKFMVVGHGVTDEDKLPLALEDEGIIEWVSEFPYLGSLIAEDGRSHVEVDKRIANASKAFGALKRAVFKDAHLSVATKRSVYRACVLSVLLYGSECWIPLRSDLKKLNSFHHRCVRTVLGITNRRQWEEHISSAMVREQWGDVETIETKLVKRRLEWLGHIARMQEHRLPKLCLFGWLPRTRPCGGPRRRWRDLVKRDLRAVEIGDEWYSVAQDRGKWRDVWNQRLSEHQQIQEARRLGMEKNVVCSECRRLFRREQDKACHKCIAERRRPVSEQTGAVQCEVCRRWFKSRGGLAVHRCKREVDLETDDEGGGVAVASQGQVVCRECGRTFSRQGDFKRHKCILERSKPVEEQRGSLQCVTCQRWFRSAGGLSVHRRRLHDTRS